MLQWWVCTEHGAWPKLTCYGGAPDRAPVPPSRRVGPPDDGDRMAGRPPGEPAPLHALPDQEPGACGLASMPSILSLKQAPSSVRPGLRGQQGRGPQRTEALTVSSLYFSLPGCLF